jgi:hypothetical protein
MLPEKRLKSQKWDMLRSHDREVSVVERHQFPFSKTLNDCQNSGIYKVKRKIGILAEELTHSIIVHPSQVNHAHQSLANVGQKIFERSKAQARGGEPGQLNDHRSWDYQWLDTRVEELYTASMVLVRLVHNGVERTGITDQRHEPGVKSISPAFRPVSNGGSVERPAPKNRGLLVR